MSDNPCWLPHSDLDAQKQTRILTKRHGGLRVLDALGPLVEARMLFLTERERIPTHSALKVEHWHVETFKRKKTCGVLD